MRSFYVTGTISKFSSSVKIKSAVTNSRNSGPLFDLLHGTLVSEENHGLML